VFGAADDQLQYVDLDRLLIEVIGTQSDCAQCVFSRLVAGRDDDFCRRRGCQNSRQRCQSLGSSVRIGREPQIDNSHRSDFRSKEIDCFLAGFGRIHLVVGKRPTQLAQKTCVIVYDQQ
jgi:hypothetical protein